LENHGYRRRVLADNLKVTSEFHPGVHDDKEYVESGDPILVHRVVAEGGKRGLLGSGDSRGCRSVLGNIGPCGCHARHLSMEFVRV
jgi:hypothetical protein